MKNSLFRPHNSWCGLGPVGGPTPTHLHGGSKPCQSVGRRMLLRLHPSKGVHRPLLCCNPALTCPHASIHAHTLCPACRAAPLVEMLCKHIPIQFVPWPAVPSESALSANGRNSLERALLNFFGRCARQVVENAACGAGNHHSRPTPRARVSAHATLSLWSLSMRSSVTSSAHRNSVESAMSLFSGAARAHGHSVASSCSHSCSYGPPAPALHLLPRCCPPLRRGFAPRPRASQRSPPLLSCEERECARVSVVLAQNENN